MSYRQITSGERYMISALRMQGLSLAAIADQIGRHRSSVSREIRRNQCNDGAYRPSKADSRTQRRSSQSLTASAAAPLGVADSHSKCNTATPRSSGGDLG